MRRRGFLCPRPERSRQWKKNGKRCSAAAPSAPGCAGSTGSPGKRGSAGLRGKPSGWPGPPSTSGRSPASRGNGAAGRSFSPTAPCGAPSARTGKSGRVRRGRISLPGGSPPSSSNSRPAAPQHQSRHPDPLPPPDCRRPHGGETGRAGPPGRLQHLGV